MATDDEVLAQMFAQAHRDELSWRKQEHVPGQPYCWFWKKSGMPNFVPAGTTDAIPRKMLSDYAQKDERTITTEQQTRILEIAKKYLKTK